MRFVCFCCRHNFPSTLHDSIKICTTDTNNRVFNISLCYLYYAKMTLRNWLIKMSFILNAFAVWFKNWTTTKVCQLFLSRNVHFIKQLIKATTNKTVETYLRHFISTLNTFFSLHFSWQSTKSQTLFHRTLNQDSIIVIRRRYLFTFNIFNKQQL